MVRVEKNLLVSERSSPVVAVEEELASTETSRPADTSPVTDPPFPKKLASAVALTEVSKLVVTRPLKPMVSENVEV